MSSSGAAAIARGVQKLFVGNLPWTVSTKELKAYFSRFGHVHSSNVIYDKTTGLSRGYGFIVFSTRDGYTNATNNRNHSLEGRLLDVQPAAS
ncbi:SRA stem-loop-interacting RNA-binding protein, mitochondrial-like [Uranotaenia lowii]|uniref:SRA stem-loop-interacting RNA-binding protein, mitochondrial-like n=1 Tax=Uranotaenia lowii TaxID=190385 RepID=UPI002478DF11|nr:SRA stem-loop-interacting RNA-binding protein, mitochondrial-like [Uranotaenia lowii]XP_055608700.1 SRA stem-loop-interacting RNA-binding protein, mitochondrial-like [Uranotaenia lowii]